MPRSKRSGKKVTPATVKRATAKILSETSMLERVRRVEAANKRRRDGGGADLKHSFVRSTDKAPIAESTVYRARQGPLSDIRGSRFSQVAGTVYNGNGVATSTAALFVVPVNMAITNLSSGAPFAIGDTSYGLSPMTDILKHFARGRFRNVSCVIEPFGAGASTTLGATIVAAPLEGGLVTSNVYATSAAATPLNPAFTRSSKGAVEFPAYRAVRIPLDAYMYGADSKGTFGLPGIGTVSATGGTQAVSNAVTIPCGVLIAGVCPSATPANTPMALITFEGEMDLLDFQSAWTWATPIGRPLRADEKEPAPRSVLADRGPIPPPPDDRGWVLTPPSARRGDPKWEDIALGRAAAADSVKSTPDVPNSGRAAR